MAKAVVEITCEYCGLVATKRKDNVLAARKAGRPDVCSLACAKRIRAGGPMTLENIFSKAERVDSGCFEWRGTKDKDGYGRIAWPEKYGRRPLLAHRVSYELAIGKIPPGMCVCHSCDNRMCIEPSHLWLGTIADNNRDMVKKGRLVTRKRSSVRI